MSAPCFNALCVLFWYLNVMVEMLCVFKMVKIGCGLFEVLFSEQI